MNDDLISREQCIAMILNTPTQNRHEDVLSALALRQVEIINVIERCPAVALVKHGRWIKQENYPALIPNVRSAISELEDMHRTINSAPTAGQRWTRREGHD